MPMPLFVATLCSCGFERLEDEEVSDHLLVVFVPEDGRGHDGRVHEEGDLRVCSCSFSAASGAELDEHFLAVFMPEDGTDRDGGRHSPVR
jgi:hypothetical protein